MKQGIKLRHRLIAGLLAIAMLIVAVPVMGLSSIAPNTETRVSDPSTMDHWKQYFGSQVLDTSNAGGIWTDKSVFTNASAFGGLISMDDPNNNFLVALSAIASNKSIAAILQNRDSLRSIYRSLRHIGTVLLIGHRKNNRS